MDTVFKKLDKVRKPRVHISYDLEDGGKTIEKELPFVVGVMGDYAGDSETANLPFKDRKFVQIDGDNFNDVMKKISPQLNLKVKNELSNKDEEIAVELKFESMQDFEPDRVAEQVPALNKLLKIRSELRDLLSKADRSEALTSLLEEIIQSDEHLKKISGELKENSNDQATSAQEMKDE